MLAVALRAAPAHEAEAALADDLRTATSVLFELQGGAFYNGVGLRDAGGGPTQAVRLRIAGSGFGFYRRAGLCLDATGCRTGTPIQAWVAGIYNHKCVTVDRCLT